MRPGEHWSVAGAWVGSRHGRTSIGCREEEAHHSQLCTYHRYHLIKRNQQLEGPTWHGQLSLTRDGRDQRWQWGWDGMGAGLFLSTVRSTCCGRSLEGHLTLAWKANGVHPHPSISLRWVHPSLPSTIPWQIGSPRDSFLVSFAHSRHQPIDHECSSRQVGGVSGSTTRAPSQCSFPSTAEACYHRAPYEATLAVVAHGLASADFRQLFCTLYRHISLDRITSHHRAYPHHLPNDEPLQKAQTIRKAHRSYYRRKGCHHQVRHRPSMHETDRPCPNLHHQTVDRVENPQE